MKISILISGIDSGGFGGSETFLYQLAQELKRNNLNTQFLAVKGSEFDKYLRKNREKVSSYNYRQDIIGGWKGLIKYFVYLIPYIIQTIKYLNEFKKNGVNIILIPGISDKIVMSPVARIMGIKVVWIEYAPLENVLSKNLYIPKLLYRLVKNTCHLALIPSRNTKKHLIPETRISESKMRVIPLGINLLSSSEINTIKNNRNIFRKQKGMDKHYVVGMLSRLEKEKGQDTLIRSIKYLKESIKNLTIVIIGTGEIDYIKDVIKKEKVEKYVELIGFCKENEKYAYINAFDIFTFPTRWKLEGFGLVSIEAMMMGTPLVASNHPPVPEVVGEAALLFDSNSPKKLANAILKIYKNKKLSDKMAKKGRQRSKMYNIGNVARKYEEQFTRILNEG